MISSAWMIMYLKVKISIHAKKVQSLDYETLSGLIIQEKKSRTFFIY